MPRLTPKMYTLFNKIAMLAVHDWNPDKSMDDEWWQDVSYEDKKYDIRMYIDDDDCIRADVYPLVVSDEKIQMINDPMRLW